jgi:hypothetical protein
MHQKGAVRFLAAAASRRAARCISCSKRDGRYCWATADCCARDDRRCLACSIYLRRYLSAAAVRWRRCVRVSRSSSAASLIGFSLSSFSGAYMLWCSSGMLNGHLSDRIAGVSIPPTRFPWEFSMRLSIEPRGSARMNDGYVRNRSRKCARRIGLGGTPEHCPGRMTTT